MNAVARGCDWDLAARAFWLFVVCSVGELLVEVAFHLAVFHEWQDRAGLLFGPFSPLYGVGGCAMAGVAKLLGGRLLREHEHHPIGLPRGELRSETGD